MHQQTFLTQPFFRVFVSIFFKLYWDEKGSAGVYVADRKNADIFEEVQAFNDNGKVLSGVHENFLGARYNDPTLCKVFLLHVTFFFLLFIPYFYASRKKIEKTHPDQLKKNSVFIFCLLCVQYSSAFWLSCLMLFPNDSWERYTKAGGKRKGDFLVGPEANLKIT